MKKYGLSIDPGMSNGLCFFSWDDPNHLDGAFRQEGLYQVPGGAGGLAYALTSLEVEVEAGRVWITPRDSVAVVPLSGLVVEKFTPRGGAGFSLTQASAEPLRGEGVLIGRGMESYINWGEPSQQYFMGGTDLPEKKKRAREFLKLNGLFATGKDVGQPDADDAISAELHAIAWLRRKRHMPTLVELFGED